MEDTEILLREEGSPRVAQLCRPLFRRLEGFERHRVLRCLNCCPPPPDFRDPNAARSPDDSFNRFLRMFFLLVLSLSLIKILFEYSMMHNLFYLLYWSRVMVPVMLVAVAPCIVKNKMKRTEFTPPRKEEVKTISGLIQQV